MLVEEKQRKNIRKKTSDESIRRRTGCLINNVLTQHLNSGMDHLKGLTAGRLRGQGQLIFCVNDLSVI